MDKHCLRPNFHSLRIWRYVMLYDYSYSTSHRRLAIQRRSQLDRQADRKVFKLRRDAGDILCSITFESAVGASFQSDGG